MADSAMKNSFALHETEYTKLVSTCDEFRNQVDARAIFLIDKNGQLIAGSGELSNLDAISLASLTAGNMAATESLAKLVGEDGFGELYHQGDNESIHISLVNERLIFVVIFDDRSSLGLVRLRLGKATESVSKIMRETHSTNRESSSPLDAVTDDELDQLFDKD